MARARRVYTAAECADMLDMSVDTFYRRFAAHRAAGMPASATLGRYRPEITSFDAWLKRHHPAAPPAPANDIAIGNDARALLRREYGRAG
jgi:hypothetical protein